VVDHGLATGPTPALASGPDGCSKCHEPLAKEGRKPRADKFYCSSGCRREAWSDRNPRKAVSFKEADLAELRRQVARLVQDHQEEHPRERIVGYVLRLHSSVGPVDFPEPGRRTKRAPGENGVWRMSDVVFYSIKPFEFPRVPIVALYEIRLVADNGKQIGTRAHIRIEATFPSVRLYDAKFHYDCKGRTLWANEAPRIKPRRRRQRRRSEDVVPSQTEREFAVTNTPPAPTTSTAASTATSTITSTITSTATAAVNQPEVRPTSTEQQNTELARRLEQVQRELSRVQQELSRIQQERDDDRLRFWTQKAELDEVKGLNKLLVHYNKRLQAELFDVPHAAPATVADSKDDGHSTVAVAPSPVEVALQTEASMPIEVALQNEPFTRIAPSTPIGDSAQPTPLPPIEAAPQSVPSPVTPSEPTRSQLAEPQAPPEPHTDPPKNDPTLGVPARQPMNSPARGGPPKKIPEGPLFGLAANSFRQKHRMR